MNKTIYVGTNTMLQVAHNMFERGEITFKQFSEMKRRNDMLTKEEKEDVLYLS